MTTKKKRGPGGREIATEYKLEVLVGDDEVIVFDGADIVARHARCDEPHRRVVDPAHFEGLCRVTTTDRVVGVSLQSYGRTLDDYAAVLGGSP